MPSTPVVWAALLPEGFIRPVTAIVVKNPAASMILPFIMASRGVIASFSWSVVPVDVHPIN